jgi:hypothetical protein
MGWRYANQDVGNVPADTTKGAAMKVLPVRVYDVEADIEADTTAPLGTVAMVDGVEATLYINLGEWGSFSTYAVGE